MTYLSIKKYIFIGIAIASFVFTHGVFAQNLPAVGPISNINIDPETRIISGDIINTFGQNNEIELLIGSTTNSLLKDYITALPWSVNNDFQVAIPFDEYTINNTTNTISSVLGEFDQLEIVTVINTNERDTRQVFNFSNIFGQVNNQSQSSVDFPGWTDVEYRQIEGTDTYYPYVSAPTFQRTPADTTLYLILENIETGQRANLEIYPGGSQSLSITWPVASPSISYLMPGSSYKIYLSTTVDGSSGPIASTGQSTERTIQGQVPSNGLINITNAEITDDSIQINATAPSSFSGTVQFNLTGTNPGNQNDIIEIVLGSVVNPSGSFTFPQQPQTYELGDFANYRIQALVGTEIVSEFTIGDSEVATDPNAGVNNDPNSNVSTTPLLNNTQQNIVDTGIVSGECGYFIGKTLEDANGNPRLDAAGNAIKGRMCGFSDAITLVQRVIEYIFILVLPITAIVFAYAGYLYITSGGNPTKKDAAKKAMTSVIIGVIIIMSAWLVVRTIVGALGVDTGATWFYLTN